MYARIHIETYSYSTVLTLNKLKKITATEPQQSRSVCNMFCYNLRTLFIVESLVSRRATWHLTRLQTMYNALKYRKI